MVAILFPDVAARLQFPLPVAGGASESRCFHGFVREDCQPPEKCAPKECANEPKPPRDTWLDPESDEVVVLADELPEDEPPEKKP